VGEMRFGFIFYEDGSTDPDGENISIIGCTLPVINATHSVKDHKIIFVIVCRSGHRCDIND